MMIRIFSILSALTIVLLLITGSGIYWLFQADIKAVKAESIQLLTKSVALNIHSQLDILQQSIEQIATTTTTIKAIESQDPVKMAQVATAMEQFLPQIMKLRLLPADVNELDETTVPFMGNADLIMVQQTLSNPQPATIQGQGEHRHLAITSVVKNHNQVIGVILASFKFDFLSNTLEKFNLLDGYLELKQGRIALAMQGQQSSRYNQDNRYNIQDTAWEIYYKTQSYQITDQLSLVFGVVMIPALLTCLLFFAGYRRIAYILRQDQSSVLKAFKDLMSGKNVGSYPITFVEMKSMTSSLIQFKRILNQEGFGLSVEQETDTEMDDFFDDPSDIIFADTDLDFQKTTKAKLSDHNPDIDEIESHPIVLPDIKEDQKP